MKKNKGSISYVVATIIITTIALLIATSFKMKKIEMIHNFVSNGLVSANLASDVINLDKFGLDRKINISNINNSYDLFYKALRINLGLDKKTDRIVDNKVNVDNFTIYNVVGNDVDVIQVKPVYKEKLIKDGVGNIKTPNDIKIKATSVYSKVSYKVKGIIKEHNMSNQCTTDIVENK